MSIDAIFGSVIVIMLNELLILHICQSFKNITGLTDVAEGTANCQEYRASIRADIEIT